MKKLIVLLTMVLFMGSATSQTAVNADGTIKSKGNVAIIVNGCHYSFNNGKFVKAIDDEAITALNTAIRTMCIEKFINFGFGVVNRDDEAYRQVKQLIEENKLEDYIDGIAVTAKNQGADYLFIVDISSYSENNQAIEFEISTRLVDVATNFGFHSFYKSNAINLLDKNSKKDNETTKWVSNLMDYIETFLQNQFPEQYYVAKYEGNSWYLGAYQPNGRILTTDAFYAFKFHKEKLPIMQTETEIQVLDLVSVCKDPSASGGYCKVTASKKINDFSDIVVTRNAPQIMFSGTNQLTMTFFGLNYELNSYDGLLKNRINNAVYNAITQHPGLQLIEHDHLSDLKKERDLQKGEDFIDGHVVEQMKAIGANYLLKLENFERQGTMVSFKMSLISVQENRIGRVVEVTSSIDNIENEMYKQICERFLFPCYAKVVDKKTIELTSVLSLRDGDNCILKLTKAIQNQVTSEITYTNTPLCSLKFKEYHGNKCLMEIDEVYSKQDMENLEKNSSMGLVKYQIDGSMIKSNVGSSSDVEKIIEKNEKKEKKEKRKENARNFFNSITNPSSGF